MSKKRWTIKELKETSDVEFIKAVLNERLSDCTNVYAPLSERIQQTVSNLNNLVEHINIRVWILNQRKQDEVTTARLDEVLSLRLVMGLKTEDGTSGQGELQSFGLTM
jgi:polyphosphate kinase